MRASDRRHRITIEERTEVADTAGGFTTTWSTKYYCRAAIWPIASNERIEAHRLEHTTTHRIRILYRSDIDSSMRVKYGSRYFRIDSIINPDERGKLLDILATEGDT